MAEESKYTTISVLKKDAEKVGEMVPNGMNKWAWMSELINNEFKRLQEKKK